MKRLAALLTVIFLTIPQSGEAFDWQRLARLVRQTQGTGSIRFVDFFLYPPHCRNRRLDGNETGLDCGGSCERCSLATPCRVDRDCWSGVCSTYCPHYDYAGPECASLCTTNRDSDPRNDPAVAGGLRGRNGGVIGQDTCVDATTVSEVSSDLKGALIRQNVSCGAHENCQEGPDGARCVPPPPPVEVPPTDDDRALCAQRCSDTPSRSPSPGIHCWVFVGQSHYSVCESATTARYVACWGHRVGSVSLVPCAGNGTCLVDQGYCRDWNWSCDDSDRGANGAVRGSVTGQFPNGHWFAADDFCDAYVNEVIEYVCRDGRPDDTIVSCGDRHHCEAGACRNGPPRAPDCNDSDAEAPDEGRHERGDVSGRTYSGEDYRREDVCGEDGYLHEQFCSPEHLPDARAIDCNDRGQGEICRDGICQPGVARPTCEDTDGENLQTIGMVTGTTPEGRPFSHTDSCDSLDPSGVVEWWCEDGTPRQVWFDCPPDQLCTDGACQPVCACHVDRPDPERRGTTTDRHCRQHPDICRDNQVLQYGCDADGEIVPASFIDCAPRGLRCQDGECVR